MSPTVLDERPTTREDRRSALSPFQMGCRMIKYDGTVVKPPAGTADSVLEQLIEQGVVTDGAAPDFIWLKPIDGSDKPLVLTSYSQTVERLPDVLRPLTLTHSTGRRHVRSRSGTGHALVVGTSRRKGSRPGCTGFGIAAISDANQLDDDSVLAAAGDVTESGVEIPTTAQVVTVTRTVVGEVPASG